MRKVPSNCDASMRHSAWSTDSWASVRYVTDAHCETYGMPSIAFHADVFFRAP